jgi:hypothetical protein
MTDKYYYDVFQQDFREPTTRESLKVVVLATDRGDAKRAWRYIHGRPGRSLRAVKLKDTNYNQNMTDRAVRHAEVLLGDWDG